jgi:hypothetical protein
VKRSEIGWIENHDISTFSDYGNHVFYDEKAKSHRYDVYIGGFGGCGGELLIYAKTKMDLYLTENNYSDYVVTEVHHELSPPTKCIVYIKYEK